MNQIDRPSRWDYAINPSPGGRGGRRWAGGLLSACLAYGCTGSVCKNEVVYGAPAPDGMVIAFVFNRRCGTSAGLSTHVSIVAFHDSLRNDAGNVLAVGGEQPVKISWQGPKLLVVTGFKDPIHQRSQQMDSVSVLFR